MDYQMENRTPRDRMVCSRCGNVRSDVGNGTVCGHGTVYQRCTRTAEGGNCVSSEHCGENANGRSLAMVYPISQKWEETYRLEDALRNGTIFPSLNLPFLAAGGCGCRGGGVR